MTPRGTPARPARRLVVALIRGYQVLWSSWHPPSCRFYPSCSSYALTAVDRFGVLSGGVLALRRLLRCHPWNPGGVDHVPRVGQRPGWPARGGLRTGPAERHT